MAVRFTAGRFVSCGSLVLCNRQKSVKFTKQVKATTVGFFPLLMLTDFYRTSSLSVLVSYKHTFGEKSTESKSTAPGLGCLLEVKLKSRCCH